MLHATVAELHVYPVKSARGLDLARVLVREEGFGAEIDGTQVGDREYMIVDAAGSFLTQRQHPRLALLEVRCPAGGLELRVPDGNVLRCPLPSGGEATLVTVWQSTVPALDLGDAAARYLSEYLETPCRLVQFAPAARRACNPRYAPESAAHVKFADGYPVLVIGEASLAELNGRLAATGEGALPMNRFRPNLVLAGLEPYAEDHLDEIRIGAVALKLVKPCTRCAITTTDQHTGKVGIEPLPTLAGYRYSSPLEGVCFGMNAIVAGGGGSAIETGMSAIAEYRF